MDEDRRCTLHVPQPGRLFAYDPCGRRAAWQIGATLACVGCRRAYLGHVPRGVLRRIGGGR